MLAHMGCSKSMNASFVGGRSLVRIEAHKNSWKIVEPKRGHSRGSCQDSWLKCKDVRDFDPANQGQEVLRNWYCKSMSDGRAASSAQMNFESNLGRSIFGHRMKCRGTLDDGLGCAIPQEQPNFDFSGPRNTQILAHDTYCKVELTQD